MKVLAVIFLILILPAYSLGQEVSGEKLFKQNCAVCHSAKHKIVGPALNDVIRKKNFKWFMFYTIDSKTLLEDKDRRALKLQKEYSIVHPKFHSLSKNEIKAIYDYVKNESK